MRVTIFAVVLAMIPGMAWAGSGSSLSAGSTAGHLDAPRYNVIGKTASTHVTTITPREINAPAGALDAGAEESAADGDRPRLLERRLDCFDSAVAPERDARNRFLSRCPGNNR